MSCSLFINITTIFDQSTVSSAFGDITEDWIAADRQLNIVVILIHGEPAFIAEYWRAIAIADNYFGEDSIIRIIIWSAAILKRSWIN